MRPRIRQCSFSVGAFLAILSLMQPTFAATLRVPADYPTIQAAIGASSDNDSIVVAPGTYVETLDFLGKAVTVRSSDGADVTTIDAASMSSVVVFHSDEGPDSVLEGFTLTGGVGTAHGLTRYGGAVQCEGTSPTIRGNVLRDNSADFGGGVSCLIRSHPLLIDNLIVSNRAVVMGGGIHCEGFSFPEIRDNEIARNEAALRGGGIYLLESGPTIEDNLILENIAEGGGGGMYLQDDSDSLVIRNEIRGNLSDAAAGGGISVASSSPVILDNLIDANTASGSADGGGIYCFDSDAVIGSNIIQNNTCGYDGGGIFVWYQSQPVIENNFLFANSAGHAGGGITVAWFSTPDIRNNTLYANFTDKSGGGIAFYNFADAFVEGNEIRENRAKNGGGILTNESSPIFASNLVVHNSALENAGGVYCQWEAHPEFINNTISGNSAGTRGGALLCSRAVVEIDNSILWGNESPDGSEIKVISGGSVTADHSIIEGGWPGTDNRDVDPLFVAASRGDFHLRIGSPCVDSGDNLVNWIRDKDKDGEERFVDGDLDNTVTIDRGALELSVHMAARYGTVNATGEDLANVLRVNGSAGDGRRVVTASVGEPIAVTVSAPPAGPQTAPFALYVWEDEPDHDSVVVLQPRGLGFLCFGSPMSRGTQPIYIWNNLGWRQALGRPDRESSPAPTTLVDTRHGSRIAIKVTLQGVIADHGSAADGPVSLTNAIVLDIVPAE